jgi:hypothetical protein
MKPLSPTSCLDTTVPVVGLGNLQDVVAIALPTHRVVQEQPYEALPVWKGIDQAQMHPVCRWGGAAGLCTRDQSRYISSSGVVWCIFGNRNAR